MAKQQNKQVIAAEAIAGTGAEPGEVCAEQANMAALRRQHSADQAEQRALAATARPAQEHSFAAGDAEMFDLQ